jgi:uncharacterized membrane protein
MKRHFLTGLILLLPFAISAFILLWMIDFLTDPFLEVTKGTLTHLTHQQEPPAYVVFLGRLFVLVFLFFFTVTLGFLGRKYIFSRLLKHLQKLFLKVPVIRVIYRLCHDIAEATFTQDTKLFKQTVLIPFPHKDSLAIGLVTGEIPSSIQNGTGVEVAVFVPTAPHPISGFVLLTPRNLIKPIDLSTEEAFKYIISCGTVPEEQHTNT